MIQEPEVTNNSQAIQSYASFSFIPAKMQPGENVPQEYIPIYEAARQRYEVNWQLLAAIHSIETHFSSIRTMVSPIGAIGHMQLCQ
ncbi:lytic murein transglycosylase [Sporolactobacillus laevolacticus]|uniref:Transglycosylase SLT domain-containing protein n=1 Tax=Sporolactobacillus laevolacticus DSM 442 TaxID=1395513 RepID=V6J3H7_9BACL|nr:hypothetical protein P343_01780 [Sporolactobacillus laevolacticus DSM 442]